MEIGFSVKEFSRSSIQDYVSDFMHVSNFESFMEKIIQEETADSFAYLLSANSPFFSIPLSEVDDLTHIQIIRLGLFLCYREVFPISYLKFIFESISDASTMKTAVDFLEGAFAYEMRFFVTEIPDVKDISRIKVREKDMIRDQIPRVYIGRNVVGVGSYKDKENVIDEMQRIFRRFDASEKSKLEKIFSLAFGNLPSKNYTERDNSTYFVTINENIGKSLNSNGIYLLSLLINETRFYELAKILEKGCYSISGEKEIAFASITNFTNSPFKIILEGLKELSENALTETAFNEKVSEYSKVLIKFLEILMAGTINY